VIVKLFKYGNNITIKFFKLHIMAGFVLLSVSATGAFAFPEKISLIESPRGAVEFPHLLHGKACPSREKNAATT